MQDNLNNRQATPKRGRPTKQEEAARPDPIEVRHVPVVETGIICPSCGRGMVPKSLQSSEYGSYKRCTLCGSRFRIFVRGTATLAQRI